MSWLIVAKKELKDAIRSRTLIALSVAFVVLAVLITALFASVPLFGAGVGDDLAAEELISFFGPATMLIPVIAALLGYKAIVGERRSGSLALTLSLPHTRDDVVLGKFVGRSMVLAIPTVLGFAAGFVLVLALFDAYSVVGYLCFVGAVLLIGLAYLSLSICFSSMTTSTTLSAVGVLTLYLLFRFLWTPGLWILNTLTGRVRTGEWVLQFHGFPEWMYGLALFNPHNAYQLVLYGFVFTGEEGPWYMDQWYITEWTGLAVLLLWIIVPLAVGVWRFRVSDL